jgi:hypothetical protein
MEECAFSANLPSPTSHEKSVTSVALVDLAFSPRGSNQSTLNTSGIVSSSASWCPNTYLARPEMLGTVDSIIYISLRIVPKRQGTRLPGSSSSFLPGVPFIVICVAFGVIASLLEAAEGS